MILIASFAIQSNIHSSAILGNILTPQGLGCGRICLGTTTGKGSSKGTRVCRVPSLF